MQNIFKIVSQTEAVTINTQNGQMQKTTLVMQEAGGKYADTFVAALIGNQVKFFKGDIVWAALRFSCRDYNGNTYQDITVQDIVSLSKH